MAIFCFSVYICIFYKVSLFPDLAVRELVANAIIHQDFHTTGTAPMIEIFQNRTEITNPGLPLVQIDRFLDSPPKSRNEGIASFMRRIGICGKLCQLQQRLKPKA
jgi:ATP-dependent DNA helicase RecG